MRVSWGMAKKTRPQAAIYVRISQDRDGESTATDRQEKDCRALCRQHGFDVAQVYVDRDVSAYGHRGRPSFDRMLSELQRFDVLVFWKVDRLVRRVTTFYRVLERCETAGVRMVAVVDSLDTATPMGKGVAGIIAAMGETESANLGLRVARKDAENAQAGRPHGHRRPFGYTPDMKVISAEAKAIREARDRILNGESMRSICTRWNDRGVKPTTAPGWRVHTFKRMLTGPHLAGLRVYQGDVVGTGTWKPILSVEDHERIRAVLGDPRVAKRVQAASYLLSSLVHCGRCGYTLRASVSSARARVWACRTAPGDDRHCGRLSITADPVDDLVAEMVLATLDSPALARALRRTKKKAKRGDDVDIADLESRLVQLGQDHDDGMIGRAEWLTRRGRLTERLDEARAELAAETGAAPLLPFTTGDVRKRWDALDVVARRSVVAALIDRVDILPATRGPQWDPDRVQVTWRA